MKSDSQPEQKSSLLSVPNFLILKIGITKLMYFESKWRLVIFTVVASDGSKILCIIPYKQNLKSLWGNILSRTNRRVAGIFLFSFFLLWEGSTYVQFLRVGAHEGSKGIESLCCLPCPVLTSSPAFPAPAPVHVLCCTVWSGLSHIVEGQGRQERRSEQGREGSTVILCPLKGRQGKEAFTVRFFAQIHIYHFFSHLFL